MKTTKLTEQDLRYLVIQEINDLDEGIFDKFFGGKKQKGRDDAPRDPGSTKPADAGERADDWKAKFEDDPERPPGAPRRPINSEAEKTSEGRNWYLYQACLKVQAKMGAKGNPETCVQKYGSGGDPSRTKRDGEGITAGEETAGGVGKDVPLSFFKRQKDQPGLKSASGAWELPLVAYLQKKLGLSAQSVQRIAKAIAGNLKAKGVQIAESRVYGMLLDVLVKQLLSEEQLLTEVSIVQTTKNSLRGQLRKGLHPKATDAVKSDANKKALSLHQLAKSGNATKFYAWIKGNTTAGENISSGLYPEMNASDIGDLMQWVLRDDIIRSYTKGHADVRAQTKAGKAVAKKGTEAMGDKYGIIGKVMYKYAARGGPKDPTFLKAFGDSPEVQNKLIRSVEKNVRRQLRRRGYDDNEISKLLG